jgi:hypothetical protein
LSAKGLCFQGFQNFPISRNFENTLELILDFTQPHAITYTYVNIIFMSKCLSLIKTDISDLPEACTPPVKN